MKFFKLVVALLLMALPLKAQEPDVQSTISSQIEAFLKDDFATAFSYAAPNIQQIFRSPDRFGTMVQNGYPMVYRPQSYTFSQFKTVGETAFQNVLIQDKAGRFYVAEYAMTQTDMGWKIKGVRIFERPDVGV